MAKPENSDGDARQEPSATTNTVTAEVVTALVQAGTITGGVHIHEPAPQPPVPTPRQLGSRPTGFVGRVDQLTALDRALTTQDGGATAVISAIGGTGGTGKTWLALTWAYRNLHRFPDGQLAVDLHGFSAGDSRPTVDVLGGFLDALGVDRHRQPAELDARIALYRTHTTGKRLLILLDNAARPDQVLPLLPGGNTCTVLITSRNRLSSLVARHGARPVQVDVLTDAEARTLLNAALGDYHSAATDRAVTELITRCGGFPLALGLIAAHIRHAPDLLDDVVGELRERGLGALDSDDPEASLPTVLSWSLEHLTDQQRTAFTLLGIAPGADIGLPAAANLIGQSERDTRRVLRDLVEASLISHAPGGRYSMHDLIREYARDIAQQQTPAEVREAALRRVVEFYLHTAHDAERLLAPHSRPVEFDRPADCRPHPLASEAEAMTWFDVEHLCVVATYQLAAERGWHGVVWRLAWALDTFHYRRGQFEHTVAAWRAGLVAADHLGDVATQALVHRNLGRAYALAGQHDEALTHLHKALDRSAPDRDAQAHIHWTLSWAYGLQQDDERALEHASRALELFRVIGKPVREADALNKVGWFSARLGRHEQARVHCEAALALHQAHDDRQGQADTLDSLGLIAYQTNRHVQAVDYYDQAIRLLRELGNAYQLANTLERLGFPRSALDQGEQARAAWQEAAELYRQQGREAEEKRVQRQLAPA